jgi:hypothetical protein
MLLAYLSAGSIFPSVLSFPLAIEFQANTYGMEIQNVRNYHFNQNNTVVANVATYRGTDYKQGAIVELKETEFGFVVGKIANQFSIPRCFTAVCLEEV